MFRRRRPLLRAAAVGGTAYVAGRHMGRNAEAQQQAESDQDARIDNSSSSSRPPLRRPPLRRPPLRRRPLRRPGHRCSIS